MTTPPPGRSRRRGRRRGVVGWSDWWLLGVFAFWAVSAVVDRDWSRALSPAMFFVGLAVQVLLRKVRRPGAATASVVVTIACVFVVSLVQQSWFMAVAMGVGLLAMAAVWALALWPGKSGRVSDDDS